VLQCDSVLQSQHTATYCCSVRERCTLPEKSYQSQSACWSFIEWCYNFVLIPPNAHAQYLSLAHQYPHTRTRSRCLPIAPQASDKYIKDTKRKKRFLHQNSAAFLSTCVFVYTYIYIPLSLPRTVTQELLTSTQLLPKLWPTNSSRIIRSLKYHGRRRSDLK